jgi:putative ABC transport system substrate-binding protein
MVLVRRQRLLLNYGPNLRDIYVRLASYIDRILRGTPPGELPVEEPRSIELVVNLRTARAGNKEYPSRCSCAPTG